HGAARRGGDARALFEHDLRAAVEEYELARRVADGDGVADVLQYEVEAVALAPRLSLGLLKLDEVSRQFFVRASKVCHVAEDGDEAEAFAARVEGRGRDDLEVNVRAFQGVYEREVSADDLFGRHGRARKVGGEEKVVHLKRAALALARVAAVDDEIFGA